MNEPTKENPKTSKRSKRRPAMEPLGWDEIVSQPGMGGYLSFLNGPVPLPHLQGPSTGAVPTSGPDLTLVSDSSLITSDPDVIPIPEVVSSPRSETIPELVSIPEVVIHTLRAEPNPDAISAPGVVPTSEFVIIPDALRYSGSAPEVVSIPAVPLGHRLRIRRCAATHDGHSLGEEVLYQALWKAAQPESAQIRTIVIGWRGMSQLCRMTPKNCKINTQRLIRKLALEILSPYNTPESIGTTYRVYSDQAILQRRHDAGLEWVVRSRGVEFVDPATGTSILPICAPTHQSDPH